MIYLTTLSGVHSTQRRIVGYLINNELERKQKKAAVVQFKAQLYLPGGAEEMYENLQS
jgi:hypothetical protein